MKMNIGKLDRLIRITIGGVLFLQFLQGNVLGIWAILSLAIAGILILTAIVGTCPIYSILKIKTT